MNKRQWKKFQEKQEMKTVAYKVYHKGNRKPVVVDNSAEILTKELSNEAAAVYRQLDPKIKKNIQTYTRKYARERFERGNVNTSTLPNLDIQFLKIVVRYQKDEPRKTIKLIKQWKSRNAVRLKYDDNFSYNEAALYSRIDNHPELAWLGEMLRSGGYDAYIYDSTKRWDLEHLIILYDEGRLAKNDLLNKIEDLGLPVPEDSYDEVEGFGDYIG